MDKVTKKYGQVLTPIRVDKRLVNLLTVAAEQCEENKSEFIRAAVLERIQRLSRKMPAIADALKELSMV